MNKYTIAIKPGHDLPDNDRAKFVEKTTAAILRRFNRRVPAPSFSSFPSLSHSSRDAVFFDMETNNGK